jgi:IS5 family transposase
MLGMAALFGLSEAKKMHNGISSHCRKCHRAATNDWRDRNRDEINCARREAYGSAKPHKYPEKRASARKPT